MESIQQAIKRAVAENRMRVQTPTDGEAADHVWAAVLEAMKAEGMILFDRPVTTDMLHRQIEETGKFEQALAEVAQEINEVLDDFEYAETEEDAGRVLKTLVVTARLAVTMIIEVRGKPHPSDLSRSDIEAEPASLGGEGQRSSLVSIAAARSGSRING